MTQFARHGIRSRIVKTGVAAAVAIGLALPPALAAISIQSVSDAVIGQPVSGQFTPASGDPRLIARYGKVSERARHAFSFTPVLSGDARPNRAITVVVRARTDAARDTSTGRISSLVDGRMPSVTVAPVAYDLGAAVGFGSFVIPKVASGLDLRDVPELPQPSVRAKAEAPESRVFESKLRLEQLDPVGASPRAGVPGSRDSLGVEGRLRVARNLNVTAGVRYSGDDRLQPLTDDRRDSQAVFVGTQFRF